MAGKVDSTMELVRNLAKDMGVSEADVLCLARSVASSIKKDRSSQDFIDASNEIQCEMIHVYAEHSAKKINEFYAQIMTNDGVRNLFNDMVYVGVTGNVLEEVKCTRR